jgi:hypothetical protein
MLYFRFPLSLRNVEGLLHERGIEISHKTMCLKFWMQFLVSDHRAQADPVGSQSRFPRMGFECLCGHNENNGLGNGEGWIPGPFPPPNIL